MIETHSTMYPLVTVAAAADAATDIAATAGGEILADVSDSNTDKAAR